MNLGKFMSMLGRIQVAFNKFQYFAKFLHTHMFVYADTQQPSRKGHEWGRNEHERGPSQETVLLYFWTADFFVPQKLTNNLIHM